MSQSVLCAMVGAVCLGVTSGATAQTKLNLEELKQAALTQARAVLAEAQTPAQPAEGPVVDLRVEDAAQRALDNNLDLAVERLNPRTYDYTLSSLYATYRPTATSTFGNRSANTFVTNQLVGTTSPTQNQTTLTWNASMSQGIRWGGGNLAVQFTNSRAETTNNFNTYNPVLNTGVLATYVQPLLRNFRTDGTRTSIQTTELSRDIAELQFAATTATTVASARNAYWDLVAARQAMDVARQSLSLASKLVAENKQRVEIGTMAPIDVIQAQAEEATRRQTLVQAEQTARTAELALKRLIVSGTEDPLWNASINPVDRPTFAETPIDVDALVKNAFDSRLDLQQARKQLNSNDLSLRNLRNQTLPALDLTTSYQLVGIGGQQFERSGLGGAGTLIGVRSYLDALSNIRHWDAPTWNLQLNLSYPIGTSSADANLARARLQLEQTQAQIKKVVLQIATEVTNAALQVRSNAQSVQAATAARELAERRLEAEQSKFEVGLSTNYFVVQAQRDLADAQISELRAVLNYRKSQVDLERVQVAGSGSVTSISSGGGSATTAAATTTGGTGTGGTGTGGTRTGGGL